MHLSHFSKLCSGLQWQCSLYLLPTVPPAPVSSPLSQGLSLCSCCSLNKHNKKITTCIKVKFLLDNCGFPWAGLQFEFLRVPMEPEFMSRPTLPPPQMSGPVGNQSPGQSQRTSPPELLCPPARGQRNREGRGKSAKRGREQAACPVGKFNIELGALRAGSQAPLTEAETNLANKHINRLPVSQEGLLRGWRAELSPAPPLALP